MAEPDDVAKTMTPGFSGTAAPTSQKKPAGSDGVVAFGGFLYNGERNRKLRDNREKWITYDNAIANVAIVASAVRIWTDLGGSTKWKTVANPSGDKNAERGAEIVRQGLIDARMSKPWRGVVKRQLMKKFRGFAMHEAVPRLRSDGQWVYADLAHRPQWTIYRWDIPDEKTPWLGVEQRTRIGASYPIDRARLFYSVEDTFTDQPDGVGLLRHIVDACDRLERFEQLEGMAYDTNIAGMPIGRAPLLLLKQQGASLGVPIEKLDAWAQEQCAGLNALLEGHIKTPYQSLLLDSMPYVAEGEPRTPSAVAQWGFDVVRGAIDGLPQIASTIGRLMREIARVMSAEFLLLGGEDSGGSYSMHEDKTAMFRMVINSALDDIGDDATRDLASRLVALNGLDPETCTPTLQAEPIATQSVEAACRALQLLAQAGAPIRPQWTGVDAILSRMDLPPQPELTPAELGMLTRRPRPAQPTNAQNNAADGPADNANGAQVDDQDASLSEAMGPGGGGL